MTRNVLIAAALFTSAACSKTTEYVSPEPPKLLIADNFDSGGFDPRWNEAFVRSKYYGASEMPFVPMEGHGKVMHYHVPEGSNEITPIQVGAERSDGFRAITGKPEIEEFYFEWEEFFPSSNDFAAGGQKIFRITRDGGGGVRDGCEMNVAALNGNQNLQLNFFHKNNGAPIDVFRNTNRRVPTGRWVTFGVWARLNTPGQNDGFGRLYLDGDLFTAIEDVSNRGTDTKGWNVVWIGGTFSNGVNRLSTTPTHRYIDNVRWFNTKPR